MSGDPFDVLGISVTAETSDVKKAYRTLSLQYHPDKAPNDAMKATYTNKFQEISRAYEELCYVGNMMRTDNCNGNVEISIAEAYCGVEKKLKITRNVVLRNDIPVPERWLHIAYTKCTGCGGSGQVMTRNMWMGMILTQPSICNTCNGVGYALRSGYKLNEIAAIMDLSIPPGIKTGEKFTFPGMGSTVVGKLPGNVIITTVCLDHDPISGFTRKDNDLILAVDYPLVDALCGGTFDIKMPNNNTYKITTFGSIIKPNDIQTINGLGIKGGNLHIKFSIIFPDNIAIDKIPQIRNLFSI